MVFDLTSFLLRSNHIFFSFESTMSFFLSISEISVRQVGRQVRGVGCVCVCVSILPQGFRELFKFVSLFDHFCWFQKFSAIIYLNNTSSLFSLSIYTETCLSNLECMNASLSFSDQSSNYLFSLELCHTLPLSLCSKF